jgi:DNA end-binding protein Ku
MPRPIWTGSISFGLVSVPVKLFTATESKTVSFHQFARGTGERVRQKRVTAESGQEVAYEDVVKGYEVADGEHVIVEPEELEAVEPKKSRTIDIEDFIDLEEVDPIYFQKTYHLAPGDSAAAKPYELLRRTMSESGRVGIARFVMRGKEYLAAIRPAGDVLVLETMYFADEVRDPGDISELGHLDDDVEINERELSAAAQLVESLTSEWDPARYEDTYRTRVLELIEQKAAGEAVVTETPEETPQVIDLMAALERSVNEAKGRRDGGAESSDGASGRTTSDDGFEEMTREELYEQAQRRGVPGRSKMSKDELVDALRSRAAS